MPIRRSAKAVRKQAPRVGLALAGGGPLGAIYELGALAALAESLEGLDFNDLHAYVGMSLPLCWNAMACASTWTGCAIPV